MPKIIIKQNNNNGTSTLVYEGEKNNVVLVTGKSPNVHHVEVVSKDKLYDQLKIEGEK